MEDIYIEEIRGMRTAYELADFLLTKCEDDNDRRSIDSCPSVCFRVTTPINGNYIDFSFCVQLETKCGDVQAGIELNDIYLKAKWNVNRGITLGNILVALCNALTAYYNTMFNFANKREIKDMNDNLLNKNKA